MQKNLTVLHAALNNFSVGGARDITVSQGQFSRAVTAAGRSANSTTGASVPSFLERQSSLGSNGSGRHGNGDSPSPAAGSVPPRYFSSTGPLGDGSSPTGRDVFND